jgi:hypothetical protein
MPTAALTLPVVLLSIFTFGQQPRDEHLDFPKNEEVLLVLAQAERALDQYRLSVAAEAALPASKKDKTGVEKDQQLIELAAKLIDGLKKGPDKFNGLGGLLLLTTLDDASRNAALCANSGMGDIAQEILGKLDADSAYRILAITQKCSDVSLHLYTVSESVNALFVRTTEAQEELNQQAMETIERCTEALKNAEPKKAK